MDIKKEIESLYIHRNYLFLQLDNFEKKQKLAYSSQIKQSYISNHIFIKILIDEIESEIKSTENLIKKLENQIVGLK